GDEYLDHGLKVKVYQKRRRLRGGGGKAEGLKRLKRPKRLKGLKRRVKRKGVQLLEPLCCNLLLKKPKTSI
ncbi:MAG TPA: hypothetical protein VLA46_04815, partial [Saprospiraceae bacterium]|nr:hypothetical protein [Saprospiraceae bacterium]